MDIGKFDQSLRPDSLESQKLVLDQHYSTGHIYSPGSVAWAAKAIPA